MRLDDEVVAWYRNSRAAYARGDIGTAETWYRRLRAEHSVELFYEVNLPDNVRFVHPLGTVLGRAAYGDFLVVYQGVGVGSDVDGNRPVFGNGTVLFPSARVLGKVTLGDNVWVTANTVLSGTTKNPLFVPDNHVIFNASHHEPNYQPWTALRIGGKKTKRSVKKQFFGVD